MIYCKAENGVIVDRSVWETPMPEDWPDYDMWVQNDVWQIGWVDDGNGGFEPPPEAEVRPT